MRKECWLEFRVRFTFGIPGIFLGIIDLPVRFTESLGKEAREMGVFKHARGILRGMELEEIEKQRLAALPDAEVVLRRRLAKMYIDVPTGTKKMPTVGGQKIFTFASTTEAMESGQRRHCEINRFGFPLVPDFGCTAHAYCGTTQEANLGDLLPWHKKTQMADMLKAYIIKSRVRVAENLLIVQP